MARENFRCNSEANQLASKQPLTCDDLRNEHVILGPDLGALLPHKPNRAGATANDPLSQYRTSLGVNG